MFVPMDSSATGGEKLHGKIAVILMGICMIVLMTFIAINTGRRTIWRSLVLLTAKLDCVFLLIENEIL